jgi:hypothetical protein
MIILDTEKIEDSAARENFEKISEVINLNELLGGQFRVFDVLATDLGGDIKIKHNLKFTPTDIWTTWVTNNSTISIKYDKIDSEFFVFSTSARCRVRFIVGRA